MKAKEILKAASWLLKKLFTVLKWAVLAIIVLELASFAALNLGSFLSTGKGFSEPELRYDPYSIFKPSQDSIRYFGADDADSKKIWLFGGLGADREVGRASLAECLATELNGRSDGGGYAVAGFTCAQFNSLAEVKLLQKLLMKSDEMPDIIVFLDGANDAEYLCRFGAVDSHFRYEELKGIVESRGPLKPLSAYFAASYLRMFLLKSRELLVPVDEKFAAEYAEKLEERYDYVYGRAAPQGAEFMVFWQPTSWTEKAPENADVAGQEGLASNQMVSATFKESLRLCCRAVAEKLKEKVYFNNLVDLLSARKEPCYLPDGVNLNDRGMQALATAMADSIISQAGASEDTDDED